MTGVRSGTNSSRGVRAVSWKRRRARVASGPSARGCLCGAGIEISAVDIRSLLSGRRQRVAGQPQVDVVEGGLASADRAGEPELVDGGDRLTRALLVQGHGEARADGERVVPGHTALAQRGECAGDVAVDVQLDQLSPELGE